MDIKTRARLNVALYIAHNVEIKDFHNIFKILFWSDREHLARFGKNITEDNYVVMPAGPVPSALYDYFKSLKNSSDDFFKVFDNHCVVPLKTPDFDYISESEKECIDNAIRNYDGICFQQRCELSHGYAYNKAKREYQRYINEIDIAFEGGAKEDMLKFISVTN